MRVKGTDIIIRLYSSSYESESLVSEYEFVAGDTHSEIKSMRSSVAAYELVSC